jgi:hypothetical protein
MFQRLSFKVLIVGLITLACLAVGLQDARSACPCGPNCVCNPCRCAPTSAPGAYAARDNRPLKSVASPAFKAAGGALRLAGKAVKIIPRPFKRGCR